MITSGHRPFANLCPDLKSLLLQLIREEYEPLLELSPTLPAEAWSRAVARANPILFCLNDGELLLQIGEASRRELLRCLQRELIPVTTPPR